VDPHLHLSIEAMAEMKGISTNLAEWTGIGNKFLEKAEAIIMGSGVPNAPHIKFEDATHAYQRAAEAFRIAEKWQEACDAYSKAADIQLRLSCPEEAATFSAEAAEIIERVNPADAIVFYRNCISLLCEVGRFGTAGRIQRKLAEMYEADRNFDDAIDQYRQASDYYLGDNEVAQSDLCLVKVAYYQGLMEEFDDAAIIYADVGFRCLDNNLLRFNARDYFFRSGLLMIAAGPLAFNRLKRKMMDFKTADPSFAYSRECLFLENMLVLYHSSDIHAFADHVYNFDNVSHLDSWCLEMLYEIRNLVQDKFEAAEIAAKEEQERLRQEHEKMEEEKREKRRKLKAAILAGEKKG